MRKLVVLLLVLLALAGTNPSREQFRAYIQTQVEEGARQAGKGGLVEAARTLKNLTSLDLVRMYASGLAEGARQQNFLVFTLYTVKADHGDHVWIGICQRFLQLK
ncbi:MAG TPA: hypothetical protein VK464_07265 [Symbiobacteriaceae bacterium]|jgi:hypothetical protein|nr:hypothetical protein [Symbiobacteriaceae bacterium]